MKRPTSIYLPAIAHNRLATYISNSLDGQGSFSGFVRFVEEQNFAGNIQGAPGAFDKSEADQPFSRIPRLPARKYWQPLDAYVETWTRFTDALPWYGTNPTAAHVLGMYALREHRDLWTTSYQPITDGPYVDLPGSWDSVAWIQREMRSTTSREHNPLDSAAEEAVPPRIYRPIIRRNRIELTLVQNSEPVSLHLDAEHHQNLYGPFGNRFFERLVHSLVTQFEVPDTEIDIEQASRFLELGLDGAKGPNLTATARCIASNYARIRIVNPEESLEAAVERTGYTSLEDPALLSLALDETYTRFGDESSIAHLDSGVVLADDLDQDALSVLRLANQLGLIDESPVASLPARIGHALRDRYGIIDLAPTRDNAFRLLTTNARDDANENFGNAIDLHVWSLFHIYAQHCLPTATVNPSRLYRSTLSTLAEPRTFLRQATLEAFTGTTVAKDPKGTWRLSKSRRVVRELSNREALAVGNVLNATVNIHDPITTSSWVGAAQRVPDDAPEPPPSLSLSVGLEVIDQALHHLTKQGGDVALAAMSLADELLAASPRTGRTPLHGS